MKLKLLEGQQTPSKGVKEAHRPTTLSITPSTSTFGSSLHPSLPGPSLARSHQVITMTVHRDRPKILKYDILQMVVKAPFIWLMFQLVTWILSGLLFWKTLTQFWMIDKWLCWEHLESVVIVSLLKISEIRPLPLLIYLGLTWGIHLCWSPLKDSSLCWKVICPISSDNFSFGLENKIVLSFSLFFSFRVLYWKWPMAYLSSSPFHNSSDPSWIEKYQLTITGDLFENTVAFWNERYSL